MMDSKLDAMCVKCGCEYKYTPENLLFLCEECRESMPRAERRRHCRAVEKWLKKKEKKNANRVR